jgi:hypothetical protein
MHLPDNFFVLDVETTSLNPATGSLLSIGAVKQSGATFYGECRPNEGAEMNPLSLKVNGYTPEQWDHQRSEGELVADCIAWLGMPTMDDTRWVMGGRNPAFDYAFLKEALSRSQSALQLSSVISRRLIDLHPVVYLAGFQSAINIGAKGTDSNILHQQLGLPVEGPLHNALKGAQIAMQAFQQLQVIVHP